MVEGQEDKESDSFFLTEGSKGTSISIEHLSLDRFPLLQTHEDPFRPSLFYVRFFFEKRSEGPTYLPTT